ncbi:hypothetical protein [Bacillus sp. Marseille-P3661]|uniref:hypothetical protein n=1 Tax=Bacillus sp. Marseille-P3661 TaxID=1936234 RepID=UPI0015E1AB6B|nr:hypothetical protein [Bacillus sp. Marseille-P3661]
MVKNVSSVEKVKAFQELVKMLNYFWENRDRPAEEDFNFFQEVKTYCEQLDLDYEEFKRVYNLTELF